MGSLQTTPPPELEVDVVVTDVEAVVVVMTDDQGWNMLAAPAATLTASNSLMCFLTDRIW